MKKPILSISILCSGRKETKKCLDSLKTLRERVPSELILVDTGCDEEMKQLLKEYADRIIPFTWCDDFSKARNAGLEAANGYWFMFLDDDEWFFDTKAIEEFFVSGEYRDYGSANYYVRSYTDYDGKVYKESCVTRLTFLSQGVKFKGLVHETFFPLFSPIKLLPAVAGHFGYVFKTEEEHRKHSERNITLLEKALPKERDNLRIWIHLVQEYLAQRNYTKLKAFCEEALKVFEGDNSPSANRDRGCFYCGLLEAEWYLSEYDQMKEDYERALSDGRNTDCCIAQLMIYGLDLAIIRREKEKEDECCKRYLTLWEEYRSKPEEVMLQDTTVVNLAFHPAQRNKAICYRICLDLEKGDAASLKRYFDELGWEEKQVLLADEFIPALVKAMSELPYEEIFTHAAGILANRPDTEKFWEAADAIESKDGIRRLGKVFSGVEVSSFDRYRQIVDTYMWNASKKKIRNLQEILREEAGDGEGKGNGISAVPNGISFLRGGGQSVRREYFLLKLEEAAVILAGREDAGSTEEKTGETHARESAGTTDEAHARGNTEAGNIEAEGLGEKISVFVTDCLRFYGVFYQERAFQGEMEFLPKSGQAAVKLRDMLKAEAEDDWAAFSAALKEAVGILPELGGTLKAYARLYAEERAAGKNARRTGTDGRPGKQEETVCGAATGGEGTGGEPTGRTGVGGKPMEQKETGSGADDSESAEGGGISAEMKMLAGKIKAQIPVLLSQGMKKEAEQVLRQLKMLTPGDEELEEIEKKISGSIRGK